MPKKTGYSKGSKAYGSKSTNSQQAAQVKRFEAKIAEGLPKRTALSEALAKK